MARRSSARLRAKVSSTPQPQRVSNFGHDGAARTPKTAPKLTSLAEGDEMPGAFPQSASPDPNTPTRLAKHIAHAVTGGQSTPTQATPIKPSVQEMHPQKYHGTTAKPLDEARWLGFSNMVPQTEPAKGSNKIAVAQGTPTKVQKTKAMFEHPAEFEFTFQRPSLGLSPEARKLMSEKREEAAKIRDQMLASEEAKPTANDLLARKMATPKSKVGRFSDVHMSAFKKMDSIANHPTVRIKPVAETRTPKKSAAQPPLDVQKSLKRSPSKAELDSASSALPRPASKRDLNQATTQSAAPKRDLHQSDTSDAPSKRVKRAADDDTATARPRSAGSDAPSTPKDSKSLRFHPSNPHLSKCLSTPTASSLARAASVKSIKRTGIPGLSRTCSKPNMTAADTQQPNPPTPLLARSPLKMAYPSLPPNVTGESRQAEPESPLLSRSPVKHVASIQPVDQDQDGGETDSTAKLPYLARSPAKMPIAERVEGEAKPSKTPLLSRSPSKIAMPENPTQHSMTPAKATSGNLLNRFKLLRASPVKSILRTPQRLYSNDPLKLANGTHFATPEKTESNVNRDFAAPPKTAPVAKHVDFSASTKGISPHGDKPETPSKKPSQQAQEPATVPAQPSIVYPSLPSEKLTVKKSHRRMTMALPSDFTFRLGEGITFAPSPNRAKTVANMKASIRHVSAEPDIVPADSKKRKFSGLEESKSIPQKQETSDKENDADSDREESDRPAKKARPNALEPPTPASHSRTPSKTPSKKIPTLGVRPKSTQKPGDKRPGLLSQARLNMLAMPKRRPAK